MHALTVSAFTYQPAHVRSGVVWPGLYLRAGAEAGPAPMSMRTRDDVDTCEVW